MAQVNRNGGSATKPKISMIENYAKNLSVNTTANFVNLLDIDSRGDSTGNIIIHNDAGGDLDYQILANAKPLSSIVDPAGSNDDDKGWVTLATGSVATTAAPSIQTLSNPYTRVIVQIKHTSSTTNVDIWHRGEN